jgi:CDP-diacylglycerol--glycerol-3-phosphate 3-phosphatidyltransferase
MWRDFLKIPNLITIGRLLFLIPAAYFLSLPGPTSRLLSLLWLGLAVGSDYFDGYFARKLNQITPLGLILDPLSDKIMAATLVLLLIPYRAFPVWLAAVIVGRDLLIAAGGLMIRRRLGHALPSNLAGKYCFASVAFLLVCYIGEFPFGIGLFTGLTLVLIPLSLVIYGRAFVLILRGIPYSPVGDTPLFRAIRYILVIATVVMCGFKLLEFAGLI